MERLVNLVNLEILTNEVLEEIEEMIKDARKRIFLEEES